MRTVVRTLLYLAAGVTASVAAVFLIVMSGMAGGLPAGTATARRAMTPATLVVSVQTAQHGLTVRGVLLREYERIPVRAEDRVYRLDPAPADGDRPLTWRELLTAQQAVHHV